MTKPRTVLHDSLTLVQDATRRLEALLPTMEEAAHHAEEPRQALVRASVVQVRLSLEQLADVCQRLESAKMLNPHAYDGAARSSY